jgi:hypothetical protein
VPFAEESQAEERAERHDDQEQHRRLIHGERCGTR